MQRFFCLYLLETNKQETQITNKINTYNQL